MKEQEKVQNMEMIKECMMRKGSKGLRFSFIDEPYPNPEFHIDEVTYVRRWIKEPWILPENSERGITKELSPDDPRDTHTKQYLEYQPNTFASTYSVIRQWVKGSSTFLPDKVENRQVTANSSTNALKESCRRA